jgi:hypothetical protein
MSLAKLQPDDEHAKTSVNPAENTKNKNTQLQNPNNNQVSVNGNTTDGNDAGEGVHNVRNNPQGNKPMSVDKGKVGAGGDTKH